VKCNFRLLPGIIVLICLSVFSEVPAQQNPVIISTATKSQKTVPAENIELFNQMAGQNLQVDTTDQALLDMIKKSLAQQQMQGAGSAPIEPDKGDIAQQVKVNVNRLNSTSQMTEQSFGRNRLLALGAKAVPYLTQYLKDDKRTYVRVQIARILGKIGDETAIPSLEESAQSQYNALNKNAITAIGDIGGENGLGSLNRLKAITTDPECVEAINASIEKISQQKKQ
jgi:hypothetical protein